MSETRDNSDDRRGFEPEREARPSGRMKRVGTYLGLALVIFLLGFVPMWLKARETASQRDEARRELRVSRVQNALASAAVDAARGDYEPARQSASDFFTALRDEADASGEESTLTAAQRDGVRPLLQQRDDLITLLARSDPAATARLLDMHAAFRKAALTVPPESKQGQGK